MRSETLIGLRADLWDYNEFKKEIEAYEDVILNKGKVADENIGGSRSGFISDPTAATAIKLASPNELEESIKIVNAIDHLLNVCTKEHYDVLMSKYINGHRRKKNTIVAHECHLSESSVKRRDLEALEMLRVILRRR